MLRMFYEPEQDMHRLRILLAGDGSGNSDIGGDEFCIIFRFGGDSERVMTAAGGIGRFAVTVVAAMARSAAIFLQLSLLWRSSDT